MNRRKPLSPSTRRTFVRNGSAAAAALALGWQPMDAFGFDPLEVTPYVDHDDPAVRTVADRLRAGRENPRDRALAAFDYVRDAIRFGFANVFYDMKASEVIAAGIGFCNTKSTLMTALLRAMGIPARQVFVDIDAAILSGILDPGTPFVDHSYVEVLLDGRWIALDAYIVDLPLHRVAMRRLRQEGRPMGYGVHRDGLAVWDGQRPAFSQFVASGSGGAAGPRRHGVFRDVADFYARAETRNRLSAPARLFARFAFASANRRLGAIRAGADG